MTSGAPDTSVVIAGLASWHPDHEVARRVLAARPPAIAHVLVESYSVLTRLPAPRRISADLAWAAIERAFPAAPMTLPATKLRAMLRTLAAHDVAGGAVYDALVAATAVHAGCHLVTLDRRAEAAYAALGAEVRWLA